MKLSCWPVGLGNGRVGAEQARWLHAGAPRFESSTAYWLASLGPPLDTAPDSSTRPAAHRERATPSDRAPFIDARSDEIFRTEGFKILETPVRTPVANTFAERWIGSIRRELLDRTIIWNRRQLDQLVADDCRCFSRGAAGFLRDGVAASE